MEEEWALYRHTMAKERQFITLKTAFLLSFTPNGSPLYDVPQHGTLAENQRYQSHPRHQNVVAILDHYNIVELVVRKV